MQQNRRDFDKEAATWDIPLRIKLAEDVAQAMCAQIRLSPEMDILDFGCGTGLLSLALHAQVRSVTGMDTSQGMLDVFRYKIARQSIKNIQVDVLKNDQGVGIKGCYHMIVMNMTLHHIRDVQAFLKTMQGALLSGGVLAVSDLDPEDGLFHASPEGVFHNGFDRTELRAMWEAAGFKDVRDRLVTQVVKPDADGVPRSFGIFLMTGVKG